VIFLLTCFRYCAHVFANEAVIADIYMVVCPSTINSAPNGLTPRSLYFVPLLVPLQTYCPSVFIMYAVPLTPWKLPVHPGYSLERRPLLHIHHHSKTYNQAWQVLALNDTAFVIHLKMHSVSVKI